jgi:exodeoxyribonuclease VII large subunit
MSRLPFDPEHAAGAGRAEKPARRERKKFSSIADAKHLTVSQVSELIKNTLEQRIPSPLRVIGQLSNLSDRNHWYFSLKDADAVLSCVAWASAAKKFNLKPKDGDEVIATGHISHFAPQGRTQFYVTNLQPVGTGALEAQFRALCDELRKLGYFEEARKKPLPFFPRRVAVITSRDGAAVKDVIATAAHRCRAVALLIVDVRVQGEGAAEQVASAIRWVDRNRDRLAVDAILVTRGGGSIEDLWAFNERVVADATIRCSVPIVAAIGHESDTTIIELVADLRAATPTQAAMRLVPDAAELSKQLLHVRQRLQFVMRRRVEHARHRLHGVERHPVFVDPVAIVRAARERVAVLQRELHQSLRHRISIERIRLERLIGRASRLHPRLILERRAEHLRASRDRLTRSVRWLIQRQRDSVNAFERALLAVDPVSVLQRGFSITQKPDGTVVRSTRQVRAGERIITRLGDGSIRSLVDSANVSPGAHARSSSTTRRAPAPGQLDLFNARD